MRYALLALLLLACDDQITSRYVGQLEVEPPLVLFPSAPEGALQVRDLRLRNTGRGELVVLRALGLFGGDGAVSVSWLEPTDGPLRLAEGEAAHIVVTWQPRGEAVEATLQIQTSVGVHEVAIRTAPGRPALLVAPNPIELDTVEADEVAEVPVTLVNLGSEPLGPIDARFEGARAGDFGLAWADAARALAPGEQARVRVVFRAPDTQPSTTFLVLRAPDLEPVVVPVRANVDRPCLRAEPVHFSRALIGRTSDLSLHLTACTDEPVQLTGLSLQGDAAFGLTPPPLPTTLTPGETLALPVHFRPVREGTTQATVYVRSDDPLRPSLPVVLTGRGVHNACPEARPSAAVEGPADAPHLALDGSGSVDADAPDRAPVAWRWSVLARPEGGEAEVEEAPGAEDDPATPTARFSPDAPGTWRLALQVEDAFACVDEATLAVVVRDGPVDVQLEWVEE